MKPASVWDWLGPLTLMALLIAYLHLSTPSEIVLCRGNNDCFREWVGTLATALAFVAAAIGSYFVYGQLSEQRSQTAFLIGDARPTIDSVQHVRYPGRAVLRVRNWNRRSMIIRKLEVLGIPPVAMMHFDFSEKVREELRDTKDIAARLFTFSNVQHFDPALILEGWVQRDDAPPLLKVGVSITLHPDRVLEAWADVAVAVTYELVGEAGLQTIIAVTHAVTGGAAIDNDIPQE